MHNCFSTGSITHFFHPLDVGKSESCSVLTAELSAPLLLQIHAIVVHRDKHRTATGTALLTLA